MKTNKKRQTLHAALLAACALTAVAFPMENAWAAEIPDKWNPRVDGDRLTIDTDDTLTNTAGYEYQGKNINEYSEVVVNFTPTKAGQRPIGVYSERFDWDNVNLTVNVEGNYSNNDALHFSNFDPHICLKSLTINQMAAGSDAINLSRDIRGNAEVRLACDVTATVKDGNGIRANASTWNDNQVYTAKMSIEGNTNITLESDANNLFSAALGNSAPVNPTAVWAGSDVDLRISGQKAYGKGEIYLRGKTTIHLTGKGTDGLSGYGGHVYGISAGKNGYIEVNDLEITADKEYSYGVSASDVNITYNLPDATENKQGTTVVLKGETNKITMNGDNSYAISAKQVDVQGNSNTVKSGENGIGTIDFTGDVKTESGPLTSPATLWRKAAG